jgi:DNA-binding response OmpR family regulator
VPKSVLVAEDEQNIAESLVFLMEKAGLQVRRAHDGGETLALAERHAPDLVLLDLMLPGRDGFDVLQALRDTPALSDVRILILTAKGRERDRRKAQELGIDGYVTKPFSTRDVVQRVKTLLDVQEA